MAKQVVAKQKYLAIGIVPAFFVHLHWIAPFKLVSGFGDPARRSHDLSYFVGRETGRWLLLDRGFLDCRRPCLCVNPLDPLLFLCCRFFRLALLFGKRIVGENSIVPFFDKSFRPKIGNSVGLEPDLVVRILTFSADHFGDFK